MKSYEASIKKSCLCETDPDLKIWIEERAIRLLKLQSERAEIEHGDCFEEQKNIRDFLIKDHNVNEWRFSPSVIVNPPNDDEGSSEEQATKHKNTLDRILNTVAKRIEEEQATELLSELEQDKYEPTVPKEKNTRDVLSESIKGKDLDDSDEEDELAITDESCIECWVDQANTLIYQYVSQNISQEEFQVSMDEILTTVTDDLGFLPDELSESGLLQPKTKNIEGLI